MSPSDTTKRISALHKIFIAAGIVLALGGCGDKEAVTEVNAETSTTAGRSDAVSDAPFPYAAIVTCTANGSNFDPMLCFSGSSSAPDTNLELKNGGKYDLYEPMNISQLGRRTADGLRIALAGDFEIKLQNASDSMILGLKIVNNVPSADFDKVLYEKKVSRFGVISASN